MYHDIAYTIAQNTGINNKDVKNKKLQADEKMVKMVKNVLNQEHHGI